LQKELLKEQALPNITHLISIFKYKYMHQIHIVISLLINTFVAIEETVAQAHSFSQWERL
jgi:uracil DNA glycosylase